MIIRENLTKENTFDELQQLYPEGMKVFLAWIDEYKKANEWDKLFGDGMGRFDRDAPKFHELPLAMQAGIFVEFCDDQKDLAGYATFFSTAHVRDDITFFISLMHSIKEEPQNDHT